MSTPMSNTYRVTRQLTRVLDVLRADPAREHYGLDIAESAGIRIGALYPIMHRLERAGQVTSRWEFGHFETPRRLYRLV